MTDAAVTPDAVTGASGQSLFGDRVVRKVAARESQLVLGLDPDPGRLWPDAARLAETGAGIGADFLPVHHQRLDMRQWRGWSAGRLLGGIEHRQTVRGRKPETAATRARAAASCCGVSKKCVK